MTTNRNITKNTLMALLLLTVTAGAFAEQKQLNFTAGFDHVGLTVNDLGASTAFFTETLGWKLLGRDNSYPATFVSDSNMMIALWRVSDPEAAVNFNRKTNVGLHHLAIKVPSFEALDALYERLKRTPDVTIEFAPELAYGGPTKHMMVREPSGNRLEFRHTP